jgi:hypothetical protein
MNVGDHFILPDSVTADDCCLSPELFNRVKNQKARILAATGENFYCLCNGQDIRISRKLIEAGADGADDIPEYEAKAAP